MDPNRRPARPRAPDSSSSISDGLRDEAPIHERLLAQLPQSAGRAPLSPAASAELFRKVSDAYREHDLLAARLSQELHVEIERSQCVMAGLRQIAAQLLGSAGTAADVAAGTDLERLSELIAGLFQEREKAKKQMRESEERFRALTENALEVTAIVTPDGRVEYASPSVEQVMGFLPAELLGTSVLDRIHTQNVSEVRRELQRMTRMGPSERTIVARFQHRDGSWRVLEIAGNNCLDHPAVRGIVINCRDITERTLADKRIRHLAHHDELTGLPNRNLFRDRAQQAMARAERTRRRLALMFLDLDRFKHVNDSLGHHVGDRLLQQMAERLAGSLRQVDTVARLGGDEFVIVLPEIRALQDLTPLAAKLLEIIATPIQLERNQLHVSVSIGISVFPDDGEDLETLMRNADTAMYHAKERGRNNFQYFTPRMNHVAQERLVLETRLRRAISQQEFVLHYQPIVSAQSGNIVGMEALVRWQDPERGLVPPAQFIRVADKAGLTSALGAWVLEEACRQNREWQDAGLPCLPVAVNLSAEQFRSGALVDDVKDALARSALQPRHLALEITETLLMEQSEQTLDRLARLNQMGLQLSIDDFGTGCSSLPYLTRFPIHKLNIDKSFVRDIGSDLSGVAVTSAVIALAHSLKLKVLAEGVETREQLDFLRQRGCEELQGNLFSQPLAAADFAALLRAWDACAYASRAPSDPLHPFIAV